MNEIWDQFYWGNTVKAYAYAIGAMLLAWMILKFFRKKILSIIRHLASRTNTQLDDIAISLGEKFILPYLYIFINYHIITQLQWNEKVLKVLHAAFLFVSAYYIIRLINATLKGAVQAYLEFKEEPAVRVRQMNGMIKIVQVLIGLMGLLILFNNLGYNITALIAGMGVGGIAIALAAQNILSDLFSYLVIFFDKPFETGDFIVMGAYSGTVEKIGVKTSHVRSLDGQQLIVPNAEISKSVIQNFKRLQRRRVVFSIGVVYDSTADQLRRIPAIIESIIRQQNGLTFERAHLKTFGEFSINYEIVYYVETSDYLVYMDAHQEICLELFKSFEAEGIAFAFPTQTIFFNQVPNLIQQT